MTDKKHETKVKNCLTGKENSINVVVQSSNNRGKTTIPADKCNTGMPIDEIRGEKKIHLIFETNFVKNSGQNGNKPEGIKIKLPKDLNPDYVEIRHDADNNKYQLEFYFEDEIPINAKDSLGHIDPEVHHPEGSN